jgi:hypothetical protein
MNSPQINELARLSNKKSEYQTIFTVKKRFWPVLAANSKNFVMQNARQRKFEGKKRAGQVPNVKR